MTTRPGKFQYAAVALDALRREGAFEGLQAPADVEVIPNFTGTPDRMEAWLIFATSNELGWALDHADALNGRAESLLTEKGFPPTAIASFVLRFTSLPEIEARGGRMAFFR